MADYIKLLRVKHWVKNIFIFIPLFFAGDMLIESNWLVLILGFFSFSFIASSVYILNDYRDIESDKLHPEKSKRPLASGKVKPPIAFIIFAILILSGMSLAWYCSFGFFTICLIYFIVNLSYSFGLKNISILDVMIVAVGFNLRIKGGGILSDVDLSSWINIMVFQLSLFMAIAKRRDDILIRENSGVNMRKSLSGYNRPFLDIWLGILSAIIIVSYLMYTLSPEVITRLGTYRLYYTCVFVIAGLMRYMQLVFINNDTSSPIKVLFTDRLIQVILLLWVISYTIIIYLPEDPIFKQ
jgi:decaprenyl-phosphate phosphoribosyltransferase